MVDGLSGDISPLALREALAPHGLAPRFHVVMTVAEALSATRSLGLPVMVRPAARYASSGTRIVEHIEDLPLAFAVACRACEGALLVESLPIGTGYYVRGTIQGERVLDLEIIGRVVSAAPLWFDWCLYRPAEVAANVRSQLLAAAATACRAANRREGGFCLEVMVSGSVSVIQGLHAETLLDPWLGPASSTTGGMAVAWMHPRSGVVTAVTGIEDARDVPGVLEVRVAARPGDVLGHATDDESRGRAGYVMAMGDTGEKALDVARVACACVRIETRPTL